MLSRSVERLEGLIPPERTLVVTGPALASPTRELLARLPEENILVEPEARSTAPALAWASWHAWQRDPDAVLLSLHADWHVREDQAFRQTAERALEVAVRYDVLVTVGMQPTRVEIGYGYIVPGAPLEEGVSRVERFVEKPDARLAAELLERGALWNSGLFAWSARRFFAETEEVAWEIAPHLELLRAGDVAGFFGQVTPVAVDVSHFERSRRVAVVAGSFEWDDVGTWAALCRVRQCDDRGNVVVGEAHVFDSSGSVVWVEDGVVVVDGVEDLVVVRAGAVTLVTRKDRTAHLKELLEKLPPLLRDLAKSSR
jgi:mannose-1-phosphate guanylyltransferase